MLSELKLNLLRQLVKDATNNELVWSKGYIAGFLEGSGQQVTTQPETITPAITVKPTIIYGTETGNAKKVATGLLSAFKKNKINARVVDVLQYDFAKLEKESLALFIVSTQGEGEFPQNAQPFYEHLQDKGINLKTLSYAVLGLGDSSYPLFNNAGILLDNILTERGAKRLLPLVKADVDYGETVREWEADLQAVFAESVVHSQTTVSKSNINTGSTRKNYKGTITHKVVLNDIGSNKETYHIEISPNDEVVYEPGDALGILPRNTKAHIMPILSYFNTDPDVPITIDNQTKSAYDWFSERNIFGLSKRSVSIIGELLATAFDEDIADLQDLLAFATIPEGITIISLIESLLPIAPRLYSISSSIEAHDGAIHLTVNLSKFESRGVMKNGLASGYLSAYPVGEEIEFYIHKNHNFRLPEEDKDIIMIGPGTGIAPFRSFLAERDATGASGKNWLFFGEQHFVHDFYYQTEIQDWLSSGVLTLLDTAFSRDQEHKIYIQDRIREKGGLFNKWIEGGASLYICGQKAPMSTDVTNAITEVIALQRGITYEQALLVLEELENEGRFNKDVY